MAQQQQLELVSVRHPLDLARGSPELFAGEMLTYATFLAGLAHARRSGGEHMLFLFIGLAAASFVDPFCLISEQIRNYFHSHASVLMYDRHVAPWQFPLFACIAYVPGAVVWALNLDLVSETLLVGFVSSWSFYGFDLLACRWLLYQWHVSDPLYTARTECVPLASSMWVITYAMTASLLARVGYRFLGEKKIAPPPAFSLHWWGLFFALTLVFLPLHILPISLFYTPPFLLFGLSLEYEIVWAFGLVGLAVAAVRSKGFRPAASAAATAPGTQHNDLAILQSMVWFGAQLAVLYTIDPQNVVSTCIHQPYGGSAKAGSALCNEKETYLFGLSSRDKYVCDEQLTHWRVVPDPRTGQLPKPKDEYYTIQGLPMDAHFTRHMAGSIFFAIGVHLALLMLSKLYETKSKKKKSAKKE